MSFAGYTVSDEFCVPYLNGWADRGDSKVLGADPALFVFQRWPGWYIILPKVEFALNCQLRSSKKFYLADYLFG